MLALRGSISRIYTLNKILCNNYASQAKSKPSIKKSKKAKNAGAIPLNSALELLRAHTFNSSNPAENEKAQNKTLELMVKYDRRKYNKDLLGSVILPKPMSQDSIVLVFAEGKQAEEAKAAGADIVGGGELIQQIQDGLLTFNKCISTPAMLPQVTKIARVLGPRGLMPTVKKGNVTNDLASAIQKFKGMFDYKSDSSGMVRLGVAKLGFTDKEITDNINVILSSIYEIGAPSVKKGFIQQVCVSANQMPGLLIDDVIAPTVARYKLIHGTE